VFLAPTASANEGAFLEHVHCAGIGDVNNTAGLMQAGWDVCRDLRGGTSYIHEIEKAINLSDNATAMAG
jgi:hypothetical protein